MNPTLRSEEPLKATRRELQLANPDEVYGAP